MDMLPAVSPEIAVAVDRVGGADLMVAIPTYNNEQTLGRVMTMVAEGLETFFSNRRCVVFVCEGGSLDETRNVALMTDIGVTVEKIVGTYRGEAGKGNALRAVFQAARDLGVRGCALIDGDIRSVTPDWVNNLLSPIVTEGYDFVTPFYKRYKFDGTITNLIVYPLVTSLYGVKLRQPIGGDFGLSAGFIEVLARQDVWSRYVAQFGIDVWMTVSAIVNGMKICQANLGAKVHGAKDPAFSLGPMYMHVISTVFSSMSKYADFWNGVSAVEEVKVNGLSVPWDPEPIPISITRLVEEFNLGMAHFSSLYRELLSEDCFKRLEQISRSEVCRPDGYCDFNMPYDLWARVMYDLATVYNCWSGNTHKLVDLSSPLYFGMVASMANRTLELDHEEAERVVDDLLQAFVNEKVYLRRRWEDLGAGRVCTM